MSLDFSDAELEAYLDEALDSGRAADIEAELKLDKQLVQRLSLINGRRDAGIHTLGEIWRRNQIGVPTRDVLAQFLLRTLPPEEMDYIRFRVDTLKCRFTSALLDDLRAQNRETSQRESDQRRKKYYESAAGLLGKRKGRK